MDFLITYLDRDGNFVSETTVNDVSEIEAEEYAFSNMPDEATEYELLLV